MIYRLTFPAAQNGIYLTHPTQASLFHPPTLRLLRNRIPETRLSAEAAGEKKPEA
jgi:hypothetical protein